MFKNKSLRLVIVVYLCVLYIISCVSTIFAEDFAADFEPEIAAPAFVLMDAETGNVIAGRNPDERHYPASITKIMTALVVLENIGEDEYENRVLFSDAAVNGIDWDSSRVGMDPGETLSLNETLYGLLLKSGNDAAVALAEYVAGSEAAFVEMMNARARELGAFNTHFVNSHGLFNEEHYTTARDIALIMRAAAGHEKFTEIISTQKFAMPQSMRYSEPWPMFNSNRLILDGEFFNPDVVGGKTGYTDESKHTLVTYGKKDDLEFIVSVMMDEKNLIYSDTNSLLAYGFDNFARFKVLDRAEYRAELPVEGAFDGKTVVYGEAELSLDKDCFALLRRDADLTELEYAEDTSGFHADRIARGETAGRVEVRLGGEVIAEAALVSLSDISGDDFYGGFVWETPPAADEISAEPGAVPASLTARDMAERPPSYRPALIAAFCAAAFAAIIVFIMLIIEVRKNRRARRRHRARHR